jgi:myo-inositol-1(or 4)-monophosphatase
MDGFWERDLKPWDIAAGALLVTEAGGCVSAIDGHPFTSRGRSVLAGNHLIHEAMRQVIAQTGVSNKPDV